MPTWRPNCLRGSIYREVPEGGVGATQTSDSLYPAQHIDEEKRGTVVVSLQKKEGCGLGLTVAGGVDKGQRPQVSNLRPGSIAHRCDALLVGDFIISVNGIRTASLKHDELINLLKNAGTDVSLEIEYEIPDSGSSLAAGVVTRCQEVVLEKEVNGFGLTLRGGMLVERMTAHPLTVLAVRPGGPADREGSVQPGDQVLAINGYKVSSLSLTETLSLFSQCDSTASFTVAYNVVPIETVEKASGPMLVEVFRPPGADLGLSLCDSQHDGRQCLCVDNILPMGIADRSGALRVGDHLLSIDGVSVEAMSVAEASQLLKAGADNHVRLEIVSAVLLEHCAQRSSLQHNSLASSFSSHTLPHPGSKFPPHPHPHPHSQHQRWAGAGNTNTYSGSSTIHTTNGYHDNGSVSMGTTQFGTLNVRKRNTWGQGPERRAMSCMSIASSTTSFLSATHQVCHTETVEVGLVTEGKGFGLVLKGGVFPAAPMVQPPAVVSLEPRGAADLCGLIQAGDRVLSVNGVTTVDRTLDDVHRCLRDSRPRCHLQLEFDVAESVTPGTGTFIVKLAKRGGSTGITVHSSLTDTGEILVVSEVQSGSVAHRCGSVQPGDQLLSINDVKVDLYTPDDAMHLLDLPDDIIKLKLKREDPTEGVEGCITYTVELERHGGPLGITISGTDDPQDPIVISELTPHGLAERTGAIHVGDRLLAVSGLSTKSKPLSEAIRMLQSAGDKVTLKIARLDPQSDSGTHNLLQDHAVYSVPHRGRSTPQPPSVDSAMDSLSSSAHEHLQMHHDTYGNLDPYGNGHDVHGNGHDAYSHSQSNGVMVLAVPQHSAPAEAVGPGHWTSSSSDRDGQGDLSQDWTSDHSLSSEACDPRDPHDPSDPDNHSSASTEMDDWVKTLEEFEMGSGSEMLKQIGLSLRQRSVMSLERDPAPRVASRSQSVHRVDLHAARGKNSSSSSSNRLSMNSSASDHEVSHGRGLERNKSMPGGVHLSREGSVGGGGGPRDKPRVPQKPKIPQKPWLADKPKIPPRPEKFPGSSSSLPSNCKPSDMHKEKGGAGRCGGGKKGVEQTRTVFTPSPMQLQRVVLEKSACSSFSSEGFGFSLSDGLYDNGVFISALRKGGLAERAGLRVYDRVLQVNKTKTQDHSCQDAVPLLQHAGKRLVMVVCRNPLVRLTQSMREERVALQK